MASAIIHFAVAKRVNEKLKRNEKDFLLGSIAPDAAKIMGVERSQTHFVDKDVNLSVPVLEKFYSLYKDYLDNDFELGYYVHLITDKLWFSEFLSNFVINNSMVYDKEGNKVKLKGITAEDLVYNDYSNLNVQIIDYYGFDLSLFYEKFDYPVNHIKELPDDSFDKLLEKMGTVISKVSDYNYIIDIESIIHFIEYCTVYVLDILEEKGLF